MNDLLNQKLRATPVVPLVQANAPDVAVRIAESLARGGLAVVEVVLRTERALECVAAIARALPETVTGAGTVLSVEQAEAALDAGARFLVSPGLDDSIVGLARQRGVPIFPGIMTPTELMRARAAGLRVVKFFPASVAGGVPAVKALAGVFGDMRFMPTGGIGPHNLADYLGIPAVVACGGSWMTPAAAVGAGDLAAVERLAREAAALASATRGGRG